jgi:5'-deoxynucleotidase YfbR-like HD superfamily hydrolase
MKENLHTPNSIRTNSGIYYNLLEPTVEMIDINDIAHALSNMPRFGGHLQSNYSVAQHSVMVMNTLDVFGHRDILLEGLLHDASEAYLMDLPSPIKALLPGYYEMEDRICKVIAEKFGLQYPWPDPVKQADKEQLEFEWSYYMLKNQRHLIPYHDMKGIFLASFYNIKNKRNHDEK